uniref:glucosamine-6-phosphate deaminase n=1 Tax=Gouania willdenowi TaxID=441366 RepID=A0A8C5N779_GOUWI
MKIIIFQNLENLQRFCANQFIEEVKKNTKCKLGFATGVSPIEAYKYIIEDYKINDEFVGISPNHPQAFIKQMKDNLFDQIDIEPKNIFIPNCQAKDAIQEANDYENKIKEHGPIDFQYISLGINGHMAYNEPGTAFETFTHVAKLTEETILDMVAKKKFSSLEESPTHAITMGIQTLLKSNKKVIMVSYGAQKAQVTKEMIEAKPNSLVTASYLQLHSNCTFVLDAAAASKLSQETLAKFLFFNLSDYKNFFLI